MLMSPGLLICKARAVYIFISVYNDAPDMENRSKCHQQGTLVDFFSESQRPRDRFILNVLDIPLGMQFRQTFPYKYAVSIYIIND